MKKQEGSPGRRELRPAAWFQERLAEWQRRMGLGAWTLRPSYKPKLRGAEGLAKVNTGFLEAELTFRQDILIERGDVVIVHELTHILTDEWAEAMESVIKEMVPRKIQRDARDFLRPHEESVVEAIAHALVRTAEIERSNSVVTQPQAQRVQETAVAAGTKPEATTKSGEG
ncbi:MAG: hypothetical protein E6J32_13410 [Chloroflexi bacterium]|jgi:hypothetical protein|nr:MAG: hypothetical protein E6J32_13410 [Chloroflexota bacterium]